MQRNPLNLSDIYCQCTPLIVLFFSLLSFAPHALEAQSQNFSTKSAAFVIDANTGRVLHNYLGNELRHPASLTKMMTLYLLFEQIKSNRLTLTSNLFVSEKSTFVAPSKLGLKPGAQIKVEDAVKALIVKSANDVAVTVAENISGNEVAFARQMTQRASQIGMKNTLFRNASGLPNKQQVTTAKDMVTLALRLQNDFPDLYKYFSLETFTFEGKTYQTHNTLLATFEGVDGIKTGYTRMSGFNIISSYNAKGKKILGAVFGGVSAEARDAHMRMLLALAIEKITNDKKETTDWGTRKNLKFEDILDTNGRHSTTKKNDTSLTQKSNALRAREFDEKGSDLENRDMNSKNSPFSQYFYDIQIGVFQTHDAAENALSVAQKQLGGLLSDHNRQTLEMNKNGKFLYVALFRGFKFEEATKTCKDLRAIKIDCLPVRQS